MSWLSGRQRLVGFTGLSVLAVAAYVFVLGGPARPDQSAAIGPGASGVFASSTATPPTLAPSDPDPTDPPPPAPTQSAPPTHSPPPSQPVQPTAPETHEVALVPVVEFWSPEASISSDELALALTGRSQRYPRTSVNTDDRAALEE